MDEPGAVVRLQDSELLVFWPTDNLYQQVPLGELEPYSSLARAA